MRIAEAFVEVQMKLDTGTVSRTKSTAKAAVEAMERDKIELKTDNAGITKGMKDAERTVGNSARTMGQTFVQYFSAAAVVREIGKVIDAASDLGESVNAVNVTFGEAAAGVHALGEDSAQSLGLSTAAFNGLAVRFSAFAKTIAGPGGDVAATLDEMTTRAADFASVMNIDVAQAAELFQSGLAGETEPLRQYGIDLSAAAVEAHALAVGIGDGVGALTESEKVQARYSLLMQQTSQTQGDFAATSDSAANAQRILKAEFENARAELGQQLLPIFAQVVKVLGTLVEGFSALPGPVQAAVVGMIGMVAVAGPIRDAIGAFDGLSKVITKIGGEGGIISKLGKAGPAVAVLAVAAGAAFLAYRQFTSQQRELEERTRKVGEALVTVQGDVFRYALQAEGAEGSVAGLAAAQAALSQALLEGGNGAEITEALGVLGRQTSETADIFIDLGTNGVTALYRLAVGAGVAFDKAEALARIVASTDDPLEIAREAAEQLGDEYVDTALSMQMLEESAEDVDLSQVAQEGLAAAAASSETADQMIRFIEAATGLSRTGEDAATVYLMYGQALGAADQATQDLVLATDESGASLDAVGAAVTVAGGKYAELSDGVAEAELAMLGLTPVVKDAEGKYADFGDAALDLGGNLDKSATQAEAAADEIEPLGEITSHAADRFDDLSAAASRLQAAIARVTGPADNLRESTRAVWEQSEKLIASLEENGATMDASTEAGRANQEQLEASRDAILAHGVAMVENGSSAEEAAEDIAYNTEQLNEQLRQAGFTEDQIAALNAEYGLTPESVNTAIAIAGEEFANQVIANYNAALDDIPESEATVIKALIDEGDFAEAQRRLNFLALDRTTRLHVVTMGAAPGGDTRYNRRALGGYRSTPEIAEWGHGPEVMFPLERPSRLRELLADPRGAPVVDAALEMAGTSTTYGGLSVGSITVGSRDDLPAAMNAIDELGWKLRAGARV